MDISRKKGKKGRKIGRNRDKCAKYRAEGRLAANKARRAARHARMHPNDTESSGGRR